MHHVFSLCTRTALATIFSKRTSLCYTSGLSPFQKYIIACAPQVMYSDIDSDSVLNNMKFCIYLQESSLTSSARA